MSRDPAILCAHCGGELASCERHPDRLGWVHVRTNREACPDERLGRPHTPEELHRLQRYRSTQRRTTVTGEERVGWQAECPCGWVQRTHTKAGAQRHARTHRCEGTAA